MPNTPNAGDGTVSSNAVAYIKEMIGKNNKIHSLKVENRHLVAFLTSGVYFRVINE